MSEQGFSRQRRRMLVLTTGLGAVGAAFAATPFVLSMTPSARARALGAPVEVDISRIEPGQMLIYPWRGKPVFIVNRTESMLASLPKMDEKIADPRSEKSQQPGYAQNGTRSIKPEILVLVGICTHLGCSPSPKLTGGMAAGLGEDWLGGFYCPCHGSKFDLAGRVYKNVPAPTNLVVPPHAYLSDTRIIIGLEGKVETA